MQFGYTPVVICSIDRSSQLDSWDSVLPPIEGVGVNHIKYFSLANILENILNVTGSIVVFSL